MSSIAMPFSGAGPLLLFLAKATVLLVTALVATMSLRRGTAGSRHLVWLAALVGVLALPLLSRIPMLRVGVLPNSFGAPARVDVLSLARATPRPSVVITVPAVAPVAVAVPSVTGPGMAVPAVAGPARPARAPRDVTPTLAQAPIRVVVAAGGSAVASMPAATASITGSWTYSLLTTIAIVWAAVAVVLLGWLVAGAISVRRIVATARELTSPDWTMPLCEVADRLDLELPPRLVLSDRIEMAFACRALSPTVVLPAAAESWSDERRRAVLFHELAHVKRHDLLGHTLGRVACALYWFHPLVWTAAKHLRAESERACDDLVLSCGARPSEYAQHLLDMVTSVRNHGAPIMALPMARKKEFEGRMLAILDPAILRTAPGRFQTAMVVALLGLVSVTVAAAAPATAEDADAPMIARSLQATEAGTPARATAPTPARTSTRTPTPMPAPRATAPLPIDIPNVAQPAQSPAQRPRTGDAERAIEVLADLVAKHTVNAVASVFGLVDIESGARQGRDTARAALLMKILETDADAEVRKTAAWGLNEVETTAARTALVKAARGDADANVREMAVWALGEQGSDDAASALGDVLRRDKSARVRSSAAWALGQIGAEKEVSALESGLSDADPEVRQTAIWAIGRLGVNSVPRGVLNALTDNSKDIRLVAAWTVGEIADKSSVPAIVKAFQAETDTSVRSAELRALAAMDAVSSEVVDAALKSSDPELRKRAVGMLAGHGAGVWPWPWPWPRPRPNP